MITWTRPRKEELRQVAKVGEKTVGEVYLALGWWIGEVVGKSHAARCCTVDAAKKFVEEQVDVPK